jgi:hypothetical protein
MRYEVWRDTYQEEKSREIDRQMVGQGVTDTHIPLLWTRSSSTTSGCIHTHTQTHFFFLVRGTTGRGSAEDGPRHCAPRTGLLTDADVC